ncbi:MAG: preprotein translocase subunit SecY [Candidatus Freyarchaeota archaeon]|nr:preprotein translocase subunit SecY [Candidatus Jordarchaeia archaeon]MBS7268655.1 preprotein translocase subunit SecY [Candidatus Jordarchaeia archaeon]MBS7279511.1 preprotein translocase subunit SecY [Candidatus Jordarchaeia archaeon]
MPGLFLSAFKPLIKFFPEIRAPERQVSFREKLLWTGVILIIFLVMANTPLYGIQTEQGYDYLYFMRVILASSRGTLMELGIGPIVTAGLIMQLLVGSRLIQMEYGNPEDRALFTGTQKILAFLVTMVQAAIYIFSGAYGQLSGDKMLLVFVQLTVAGTLLILMDETIQKGWGLGSGVSLFIAANVAGQIFWGCFNTTTSPYDYLASGIILATIQTLSFPYSYTYSVFQQTISHFRTLYPPQNIYDYTYFINGLPTAVEWARVAFIFQLMYPHADIWHLFNRGYGQPDLIGLIASIITFLVVVYIESVRVEIPLQYARYRGFRGRYPIKFFYTSNIPVILVWALYANALIVAQVLWTNYGFQPFYNYLALLGDPNLLVQYYWVAQYNVGWNFNPIVNLLGQFIPSWGTQGQFTPHGGLVYYLTTPHGLPSVFADPVRAGVYLLLFAGFCGLFAYIWIDVSGLSPKDIANQLIQAGMMVPGFRRSPVIIEKILDRYIPVVTILGGLGVGVLAALADFAGALGSGVGMLLTVGIIYQYYQIIAQEQLATINPALRGLLGIK